MADLGTVQNTSTCEILHLKGLKEEIAILISLFWQWNVSFLGVLKLQEFDFDGIYRTAIPDTKQRSISYVCNDTQVIVFLNIFVHLRGESFSIVI